VRLAVGVIRSTAALENSSARRLLVPATLNQTHKPGGRFGSTLCEQTARRDAGVAFAPPFPLSRAASLFFMALGRQSVVPRLFLSRIDDVSFTRAALTKN
jgi:hypothetical protein